jgi:hypothetical protein
MANKPLTKSRTVYAAIATLLAFFVARYGLSPEVAEAVLVIGMAMTAIFLRDGMNDSPPKPSRFAGLILAFWLFVGCASHPDLRPTVELARIQFARLETEAAEKAIRIADDDEMNDRRLAARVLRFRAAKEACEAALRSGR